MKKVDLDFSNWRNEHEEELIEIWETIREGKFEEFVEECWREYQDEEGLIDKSNKDFKQYLEGCFLGK